MDGGDRYGEPPAYLAGSKYMTTRDWLIEHGYLDVVHLIDQVTRQWKAKGTRTRRNWWEVLAGTRNGRPRTVYGINFPVLVVAQKHEGRPVTPNAIQRSDSEEPPSKSYHGRSLNMKRKSEDNTSLCG